MELTREHVFLCAECGKPQNHACDRPEVPVGEIHYYHHHVDTKPLHSVEVSRNDKGECSYSVKAYGKTLEEARTLVYAQLASLDALLADYRRGGEK